MKRFFSTLLFTFVASLVLPDAGLAQDDPPHDGHAAGGELKQGRYIGYILNDRTSEKLALTMDAFAVQPNDRREFPVLHALIKVGLGGYGTAEYVTEAFDDIFYDFNNGQLTLDHPGNDLVINAEVHQMAKTTVMGQVWIRSAAVSGQIFLEYQSDEPGSGGSHGGHHGGERADVAYLPLLSGQYEGYCGEKRAAIQIQTAKDLASNDGETRGLHDYAIMGRLAFDDASLCGANEDQGTGPTWCAYRHYSHGTYNFYTGRLVLSNERNADECEIRAGRLQCRMRMLDHTLSCDLQKVDVMNHQWRPHNRGFHIRTTADQRVELSPPEAPRHTQLMRELGGHFIGNLHNETTGKYQIMRLNVVPSVSTENPHNENDIFVTATSVFHFGPGLSDDFWTQQFERRSFYQRPGFTLKGANADGFLQIDDWRRGYIRGTWYSHSFGKVGTVQLVKGYDLPAISEDAVYVKSVVGEFEGPVSRDPGNNRFWWLKTIFSNQPLDSEASATSFSGEGHMRQGVGLPMRIESGAYDHYSGFLGWKTAESTPRLITGKLLENDNLGLIWPGASIYGVGMFPYTYFGYERVR